MDHRHERKQSSGIQAKKSALPLRHNITCFCDSPAVRALPIGLDCYQKDTN
jgi:hypothetical protein